MARMSREFKLVLLGAGLLTAGSFLWPDDDAVGRANDEIEKGGGARGDGSRRARVGHVFIMTSFTRTSPARTATSSMSSSASRGGFGSGGARISGG